MLSEKSIEEFQRLYKNRYGEDISKEKAEELGMKLIQLVKSVYEDKKIEERKDAPLK